MNRRILIVDDDPDAGDVIVSILRSAGYVAEVCSSGYDALVHLTAAPYDVVLTDFVMPDMMGNNLVAEARRLRPSARCMIMSGHPRIANLAEDVSWVDKPIDIDSLLAAIDRSPNP